MEKKYQIFISSTYEDLKEERKKVQDTILSMYQFPIGMEMFSAGDEEQWEIIRETIDSSDYYVLIIGHRYGSVINEGEDAGISYSQKEFRYALEKKIPILAFLIDDNVPVSPENIEKDADRKKKLEQFKAEVKRGRMVQWWTNKDDLANEVMNSLNKQIGRKNRPGWIRTQSLEADDIQRKIVELNKTIEELDENKKELQKKIIELNSKLKKLIKLNRKVKVAILLRIGGIVILSVLLLSWGLFLVDHNKQKLLNDKTAELLGNYTQEDESAESQGNNTQEDESAELLGNYTQEDESAESQGNNTQEDESAELLGNNTQEDESTESQRNNTQEDEDKEENDKIVDWNWEYAGNADNMRRFLINTQSELGIDVSAHQKTIDWEKIRADGIDFAIIRVGYRGYTYGKISLDSKFKENIDGAIANGIKSGVYFFSQAINQDEMDEEIDELLKAIEGYSLDYPVGIELLCKKDYRTYEAFTTEEYIDLIKYFCNKIEQNGYTPMIYGSMEWFEQFPTDAFEGYYKWVHSSDLAPNEIDNCVIWQYTNYAKGIDGIDDGLYVSFNLSTFDGEND